MIELRFVDGSIVVDSNTSMKTRVLQYRYKYPYVDDNMDDYPPKYWEWSDWQDVPVVSEADDNKTQELTRYFIDAGDNGFLIVEEQEDGEWVRYSDVAKIYKNVRP